MIVQVKYISSRKCSVSAPFLSRSRALKLVHEGKEWYVGWNGKHTPDSLEIDEVFGKSLGVSGVLKVEELTPQYIDSIEVEPVDENCWEMIDSNSKFLEENLLSQVQVVSSGLLFPLWVQEGCLWVKVNDFTAQWGILKIDSQILVKPKERPKRINKFLLRNVPISRELICNNFTEGSVLSCRGNGEVALGICSAGDVRENHINWKHLGRFGMYEVAQVLPVMDNQPSYLNKLTMEVKRGDFTLKIEGEFKLEKRTVLYHGYSDRKLTVSVGKCSVNLQEWVPFTVVTPDSEEISKLLTIVPRGLPRPNKKKLLEIPRFTELTEELVNNEILPYFETELPDNAVILTGPGKTSFVQTLARILVPHYIATETVKCRELSLSNDSHLSLVSSSISAAVENSPSVLIFEDFEEIVLHTEEDSHEFSQADKLSYMKSSIHILNRLQSIKNVKVLITCTHESLLNKLFLTGIYYKTYALPGLQFRDICKLLSCLFPELPTTGTLAASMKSFQLPDYFAFSAQSRTVLSAQHAQITSAALHSLLSQFVPQSLSTKERAENTVNWASIGGLCNAKSQIRALFVLPLRFSLLYRSYPLKQPSGLLLYGPSGCGKTLLASSIPSICSLSFIQIKGPELLNKYIGASEQAVRELFSRAKRAAPSVIFIDEFESIGCKRGSSSGVTDRTVNQFLCELDGVEERENVYIVAASSRPELIDTALLRPGRLDQHIYIGFPNASERSEIFAEMSHCLGGLCAAPEGLSELTEGFTGADLKGLVNNLQIKQANCPGEALNVLGEAAEYKRSFSRSQRASCEASYSQFRHGQQEGVGEKLTLM